MNHLRCLYQAPSLLILCLSLGATLIPPPSLAVPLSQKEFCKNLTRDKSRQAFLFDETGVKPLPHFDLGHLDITTNRQNADYLMSSKRFRLVLFPKRLRFESLAGGALIDGKAVKPRCPSTNEYILEAGVIPTKVGPGKFEGDTLPFKIFDRVDLEYPVVKTAYQELMRGEVSMPWLELDEPIILKNDLKSLFNTEKSSAKVTLKNIGNRPLRFGTWEIDNEQEREIAIKENTCRNIQLEPNDYCDITIRKTTAKPLAKTFYSWVARAGAGEFETILHIDIQKYGGGEVGAEVRNR